MNFQSYKSLICCLAFSSLAEANNDYGPSGFVKASESIVREGLPVRLDWNVNVPVQELGQMVSVNPENEIIAATDVLAKVRVLGAALGKSNNAMWAEARMKGSKGGWKTIFDDYATGVGAGSSRVFEVKKGAELEFWSVTWDGSNPSQGKDRDDWRRRKPVKTGMDDGRLLLLKDGDTIPWFNPAYNQQNIDAFLAPYLEDDGQTLKLGPRDLLMLTELNNKIDSSADYQDMVVLVTFSEK